MTPSTPSVALSRLMDQRDKFLSFVLGRVRDPNVAEDLLQESFSRALAHQQELRDEQLVEAWFYRMLRNAVTDHWRRAEARARAVEELAKQSEGDVVPSAPSGRTCGCVRRLAAELKPEYSEVLERVEVEGMAVKDFAASAGLTASNAGVRVHRAREALRRKVEATCGECLADGCRDCTCGP